MKEENIIRCIFGGYVTAAMIAALTSGIDGVVAFGGLGLLAGLAGVKILNKWFGKWS